jgi:hypothetical protein
MPVHPRVIVRHVSDLAVRTLEDVVILSGVSAVYSPREPHSVPATRAFGIIYFPVHSYALTSAALHGRIIGARLSLNHPSKICRKRTSVAR